MSVKMNRTRLSIPTYEPGMPNELPFFLEKKAYQGATGRVYPLPYTDRLSNEAVDHVYEAVTLENEYIDVTLLPELGGKIHGAKAKHSGYEFIYQNIVIKPAMVGLAGPWVSGGVEFNWPQHHRPTSFMPTEATLRENPDGSKTCWMGEAEPFHRMRGAVGITVYPGRSIVEATAVVYNRTDAPLPFMWWNNLAVRVHERYKAVFPPDVEYVSDHDRRAVISFPVMRGVFRTARPFDYGEGTDATWYSNIKLPTSVMVMRGQSDMDFLGGYDFAADAGTITVADHHYSVGKKMWTWGNGDFGHAWGRNLTDNDDRYIELMTGVFTDNQPDFTYIMPGECKRFAQAWYPVHGIGEVKNATLEAAISLNIEGGKGRAGAVVTRAREGALLRAEAAERVLAQKTVSLTPDDCAFLDFELPDKMRETDLRVTLTSAEGEELVSYQPGEKGIREAPKTREIPPEPKDVPSIEELDLHAAHLMQYKHHTYDPRDYYAEALHRDIGDLRANHGMGRLAFKRGDFYGAREYLTRAVKRLTLRNDNPADPSPIYDLARLERLCGRLEAARDLFYRASWQMGWRSASYYEIACIDCALGDRARAVEMLRKCLVTNAEHFAARTMLAYLTSDATALRAVLVDAPQDAFARFALWLMEGEPLSAFILNRPEDVIDAALDFARAGFTHEAERVLRACERPSPMIAYHIARLTGEAARPGDLTYCFPNRLEDIAALQGDDWQSSYLLGCLYYDRMNYHAAVVAWERSARLNPAHAFTHRNLAQAYFDHMNRPEAASASMERALALAPANARILYELLQLKKNLRATVRERLDLLERHAELVRQRDDCYLDYIILLTQDGQYERAQTLLLTKRFNIYEGGEGKLTRHHGWLYTLMGRRAHLAGDFDAARALYESALVYPGNYGEGRHYSAQEANIYYYAGLLLRDMGNESAARAAFEKAANQPDQITELTYFAAQSLKALGEGDKARDMLKAMCAEAAHRLQNAHLYAYFGVGMPAPLPFEIDAEHINRVDALLMLALARLGLGDEPASQDAVAHLDALDPANSKLTFFRRLNVL